MSKPLDEEGVLRALSAVIATWVVPELRRRIEADQLPDGFRLKAFQLVTDAQGVPTEVRFNEDVRAVVRVRSRRDIAKDDVVLGEAAPGAHEIILTDADPNAGHFTALSTGNGWMASMDLRVNARKAAEHGKAAREFLESAGASLLQGNLRPFVQNLFDATELMAEAYLLTQGESPGKTHQGGHNRFHLAGHRGKVSRDFTGLRKRLEKLRPAGRYLKGDFVLDAFEAATMMAIPEQMYGALYDIIPKRAPASRS
jgi:hypothetical protein